jgi:hypothetical protein
VILFRYLALIRPSERFLAALASGEATEFDDQYMRITPQFAGGSPVRKQSPTSSIA